jgi:uncharacterized DUF497 family protein
LDNRFDYGEERFVTLGLLVGRLVMIAHARRGDPHYLHEEGEPS